VNGYSDDEQEACAIAREVASLIKAGEDPAGIAVFYRVNSMSRRLEEAFVAERIAYQVVRGVEFYNRREIRDIIAYLKVLANPLDELSLVRIINTPSRGLGEATIQKVRDYAREAKICLFEAVRRADGISGIAASARARLAAFADMMERFRSAVNGPVAPVIERLFKETGLEASLTGEKQPEGEGSAKDNVMELVNAAAIYDAEAEHPSLADYLERIAMFSDSDSYDSSAARTALMTLHAAKGLEFDHVFIAGIEDGLLPHARNGDDPGHLEEERRLLFVGMTRAKKSLRLSFARYRPLHGQFTRTIPSQFLYETGARIESAEMSPAGDMHGGDDLTSQQNELTYEPDDDSPDGLHFRKGELVRHPKFGLGRVLGCVSVGANSTVTVRFNTAGEKTLMLRYARLDRLQ
jgi:DNA helicase-2/ATP-dependent DNA helicase PcrA